MMSCSNLRGQEHLLMDQDDSAKRIAEPVPQLAEQKHVTALKSQQASAVGRPARFVDAQASAGWQSVLYPGQGAPKLWRLRGLTGRNRLGGWRLAAGAPSAVGWVLCCRPTLAVQPRLGCSLSSLLGLWKGPLRCGLTQLSCRPLGKSRRRGRYDHPWRPAPSRPRRPPLGPECVRGDRRR